MPEWRSITLGQLCEEAGGGIQTGPFGSQLHASDYVEDGTPSVMPQNIGDNRIVTDDIARVATADMERLRKYWLEDGDIVYSRRGDVERRALVRPQNQGWLCGTGCLRIRVGDPDVHDSRFVSYALGLSDTRHWIKRHAVGATMLNLNTSILSAVPLQVPTLSTQRAIAEVLGALDDKIAANDRILDFSDSLVRLWFEALSGELRTLGEFAANVRDQVLPDAVDPDTAYVGLEHIPRRRCWLTDFGVAADVTSAKAAFMPGDVLFGKLRPYFHKVAHAACIGIASTDVLVVRADDPELCGYVLAATSSDEAVRTCTAASEGTRMPRTSWKDLSSLKVPWPGRSAAIRFSKQVTEVAQMCGQIAVESRTLAATRDELLPLLMSGKVRVRDAEKVVEEVT